MKFVPFHDYILVEKLDKPTPASGIVMPERHEGRFWIVRLIEAGPEVPVGVKPGDILMVNPLPEIDDAEAFENRDYRLMNYKSVFGRWEETSGHKS